MNKILCLLTITLLTGCGSKDTAPSATPGGEGQVSEAARGLDHEVAGQ